MRESIKVPCYSRIQTIDWVEKSSTEINGFAYSRSCYSHEEVLEYSMVIEIMPH